MTPSAEPGGEPADAATARIVAATHLPEDETTLVDGDDQA
jgi:hypothetical protein